MNLQISMQDRSLIYTPTQIYSSPVNSATLKNLIKATDILIKSDTSDETQKDLLHKLWKYAQKYHNKLASKYHTWPDDSSMVWLAVGVDKLEEAHYCSTYGSQNDCKSALETASISFNRAFPIKLFLSHQN